MRFRRASAGAFVAGAIAAVFACAPEPQSKRVELPSLDGFEPASREAILDALRRAEQGADQSSHPDRARNWGELGQRLHAYELNSPAIVAYDNALLFAPSDFRIVYLKGQAQQSGGDLAAASRSLRRAVELNPSYLPATISAAKLGLQMGELDQAVKLAERAVRLAPRSSAAYYMLAQVESARERPGAAAKAYEAALALDPEATFLIGLLAGELARAGDLERSRALAGRSGFVRPWLDDPVMREVVELRQDARRYLDEGANAFENGDFRAAELAFSRAIERDANSPVAWLNRGSARFRLGNPDGAASDFREALRLDPRLARAHANLGILEAARDDDEAAVDSYRRALEVDPAQPDVEFNLGNALLRLGRPADSLGCYERVLAVQPERSHAALGAAASLVGLGETGRAASVLDRALAAAPANEELFLAQARLWSVYPALRPAGRKSAAEAEAALIAAPETFDRLATLAMVRSELRRFDLAADSLRRALALPARSGNADRDDLSETLRRFERGLPALDPAIFEPRPAG